MKESTTMASISTSELKRNVSVHVRVRPLTVAEQEDGKKHLQGLNLVSAEGRESIILSSISGDINGFDGILGQNENNTNVFEKCFSNKFKNLLKLFSIISAVASLEPTTFNLLTCLSEIYFLNEARESWSRFTI